MKRSQGAEPSTSTLNKKPKTEKPTKLGDLNVDCLLEIFKNFSWTDLVNVVDYDVEAARVVEAAREIFGKKFADKLFTVTNIFDPHRVENSRSMKLLKHFGGVITKLRVEYNVNYRRFDHKLDNLIVSHCCKSLMEIKFINADLFTMNDINESFQEVRKVTFTKSKCGYLISNFGKWFPKADTLFLEQQRYQDYAGRSLIEQHHPALKHFKITNTQIAKSSEQQHEKKISTCNIANFVKQNPQLISLWIVFDKYELVHDFDGIKWDYELLAAIQSKVSNLGTLYIEPNFSGKYIHTMPKFNFDNLKNLTMSLPDMNDLNKFFITAKKLESLNLRGYGMVSYLSAITETYSNIKVFKISSVYYADLTDFVTKMINCAPRLRLLTELHIRYENRPKSAASMVSLLNAIRRLNLLVISAINVESSKKLEVFEAFRILSANINGWEAELQDEWENKCNIRLKIKKRI